MIFTYPFNLIRRSAFAPLILTFIIECVKFVFASHQRKTKSKDLYFVHHLKRSYEYVLLLEFYSKIVLVSRGYNYTPFIDVYETVMDMNFS